MTPFGPDSEESRSFYVHFPDPIGVCYLQMKPQNFHLCVSMWNATMSDSDQMDHESAVYWHERAVNEGAVFL